MILGRVVAPNRLDENQRQGTSCVSQAQLGCISRAARGGSVNDVANRNRCLGDMGGCWSSALTNTFHPQVGRAAATCWHGLRTVSTAQTRTEAYGRPTGRPRARRQPRDGSAASAYIGVLSHVVRCVPTTATSPSCAIGPLRPPRSCSTASAST